MIYLFKKNPFKCRYIEITWVYPLPEGAPMIYKHKFTNKPTTPINSLGRGGRGYICYDLDDRGDLNKICQINSGYKRTNKHVPYLNFKVVDLCVKISNQRRVNKI